MNILDARDEDGTELTMAQIKEDWSVLLERHEKAKLEEPTWSLFGGILYVGTCLYQVV